MNLERINADLILNYETMNVHTFNYFYLSTAFLVFFSNKCQIAILFILKFYINVYLLLFIYV